MLNSFQHLKSRRKNKQTRHVNKQTRHPEQNEHVTLNSFQGLTSLRDRINQRSLVRFRNKFGMTWNVGAMRKPAFTLSGLLLTVLVSSIILVALAPVVTRRISETYKPINVKTKGALFTLNETDLTKCNIDANITGKDENTCSITLPNGVTNINAVVVGFGGNGTDAIAGGEEEHVRERIYSKSFTSTMVKDGKTYLVKNLKVDYMVGGGAGGGAGWGGEVEAGPIPQSQQDCNELVGQDRDVPDSEATTKFIPASMNGTGGRNLCVSKFNAGDPGGAPLTVERTLTGSGATSCTAEACCWGGDGNRTVGSGSCTESKTWGSNTIDYSGCFRTVCNWRGANAACSNWAPSSQTQGLWRLPKNIETAGWALELEKETSPETGILSKYLGNLGLQLCDSNSSSYGSLQCNQYSSLCKGATFDYCKPNLLWTYTWSYSEHFFHYVLSSGRFTSDYYGSKYAASARCVYDGYKYVVNSGAGGGAGSYLTNHMIHSGFLPSNYIHINITSGSGGSGGTSTRPAQNGGDTVLRYGYTSSTTLTAYGGKNDLFGESGSEEGFGKASIETRRVYSINSDEISYNAAEEEMGKDGESDVLVPLQVARGGDGGNSAYQFYLNGGEGEPTYSAGGLGGRMNGTSVWKGGGNANYFGAGGGGGSAVLQHDKIDIGTGGNGSTGTVIISYDLVSTPSSGAGGAGGGMVVAKNLAVNAGEQIQVSFDPLNVTNAKGCTYVPQLSIGGTTKIYSYCGGNAIDSATAGVADIEGGIVEGSTRQGTFETILGMDGELGGAIPNSTHLFGGLGGASGTNTISTCGGMQDTDCQKFNPSTINANGSNGLFSVTPNNIPQGTYGFAGSGGGGGGYDTDPSGNPILGTGGEGAMGYVYIWWTESE